MNPSLASRRPLALLPASLLLLASLSACADDPPGDPAPQGGAAGLAGAGASGSSGQPGGAGQGGAGAPGQGGAGAAGDAGAGDAGAGAAGAGQGGAGQGGAGQGGAGQGGAGQAGAGAAGEAGAAGVGGGAGAVGGCGDGVLQAGEACDGAMLGGKRCAPPGGLPAGPDGAPLKMGGPGELRCTASCALDEGLCDPPERAIGYLNVSPSGEAALDQVFRWDAQARVFRPDSVSRPVLLPAGAKAPSGPTLLASMKAGDPLTLAAGAQPPDYFSLRIDEAGQGAPLYDPCWDHACDAPAPRPKLAARRAPLMLRHEGTDAHVPGTSKPWVPGRGKIRLVLGVVYADTPMPAEALAALMAPEGAESSTSLAAVPPWFAARSKELGLPVPVEVEVVSSGVQVKLPPEQVPSSYDACVNADWKPLLAPQVPLAEGDVLVQFYWAPDGSQCANHVLWASRSFVLFATPSFFTLPGLTVSGAHELMHLLGASDKYTTSVVQDAQGNYQGCWFGAGDGYAPTDIMCHRVAVVGPDGTFGGFDNPPLHQLTVEPLTAREVGWEDLDGDGVIEIEDACPWDGGC